MRIAVCDDEKASVQILYQKISAYCERQNLHPQVDCYACGEDFLQAAAHYDIIFMDIYLPGISGIETVCKLCKSRDCAVVFMTVSRDYAVEAFHMNAAHYLVKPVTEEKLAEAMQRCFERAGRGGQRPEQFLKVNSSRGVLPVPFCDIVYIEKLNKACIVHTQKSSIHTCTTLNAIYSLLQRADFMRAQRSFVVNMNYIETYFFDRVVMQGGQEIMLSRSNRAVLKAQYQHFLFDLARRGGI